MKVLLLPAVAAVALLAGCSSYGDPFYPTVGNAYPYGYATSTVPYGYAVNTTPYYGNAAPYGYYGPAPARIYRDTDRDGIPNRRDADRDNDGVPNLYDARPANPYRR